MFKRIYRNYATWIILVLICAGTIFYLVFSSVTLSQMEQNMFTTLELFRQSQPEDPEAFASLELSGWKESSSRRLTIIGTDGKVYYDSDASAEAMENHLLREEIQEALQEGRGEAVRESSTLHQKYIYAAVLSPSGQYIYRLSMPYTVRTEYTSRIIPGALLALGAALVIGLVGARYLTRSITEPLEEISAQLDRFKKREPMQLKDYSDPELENIVESTRSMSEAIEKNLKELETTQKVRQEFFSNASHELKTPLTSIRGYTELLASGAVTDPAQTRDFYQRIFKETEHMTTLIQDILTISRLESEDVKPDYTLISLQKVTGEVLDEFTVRAKEAGVTIFSYVDPEVIRFDEQHYRQLVSNLVSNAVKYNRPQGKVFLTVSVEKGTLVICVEDTGVGISEEDQARVFERFFRVDQGRSKKIPGTGLGLSIVKHIVQYYRGDVQLKSEQGIGTMILVNVPISNLQK